MDLRRDKTYPYHEKEGYFFFDRIYRGFGGFEEERGDKINIDKKKSEVIMGNEVNVRGNQLECYFCGESRINKLMDAVD